MWRAYGIAPINATPEDAIAAAEATDKFRREAAKGPPRKRRPYAPPERDAPPAASLTTTRTPRISATAGGLGMTRGWTSSTPRT